MQLFEFLKYPNFNRKSLFKFAYKLFASFQNLNTNFKTLKLEKLHDHVLLVALNRPDIRNAINIDMMQDLLSLWSMLFANKEEWRCIILTGTGEKAFCAGADLKERAGMEAPARLAHNRARLPTCGRRAQPQYIGVLFRTVFTIYDLADEGKVGVRNIGARRSSPATSVRLLRVAQAAQSVDDEYEHRPLECHLHRS